MEKKLPGRAALTPGKSSAVDSKLNKQDVSNIRFSRGGGRRREGIPVKSDPPYKPWPQRQRGDKRPQARSEASSVGYRYRNQVDAVDNVEIGSAARPGSKKVNLNHLLNFTYDRREGGRSSCNSWRGGFLGRGYHNRAIWTTRKHKYNKEQFLQANCQFVVQEGQDYSVNHTDPDLLVDWEWIEQVRLFCHEVPSCPICLYPPVAAKMTRCGHIYCWPCILHYLALSDKSWRKCPICYEAVHRTDLKSVIALQTPSYSVGEEITMQLMQRQRGSVIALPRSRWKQTFVHPFHIDDKIDTCFAKLLVATKDQVLNEVLEREEGELAVALEENGDCPEVCFVQSAVEEMQTRKASLLKVDIAKLKDMKANDADIAEVKDMKIVNVDLTKNVKSVVYASAFDEEVVLEEDRCSTPLSDTSQLHFDERGTRHREISVGSDGSIGDDLIPAIENLDLRERSANSSKVVSSESSQSKDFYYFYQALNGQHIYMHAVNVHMLIQEYGSLEQCPDTITATIVEKEGITMNEDLRRRLRYLAHLPLTCEFEVVELNFQNSIVSQETLDAYAEEIAKRQNRRNRRAREEHRRERHLRAEENRRCGKIPTARIHLDSRRHFPEYPLANADETDLSHTVTFSENLDAILPPSASSSSLADQETAGPSEVDHSGGPSFAQMLREGKAKPQTAPQNNTTHKRSLDTLETADAHSDSDLDEAMPAPSYRESFGAALQDALDKSVALVQSGSADAGIGRHKKRNKQKRLLFATSVIRSK